MPRALQFNETAPLEVRQGARGLGRRISLARKRRQWTLREMASKAGISYETARAVEAGNLQTGLGAYLALLWAMGLQAEIDDFAASERDEEGKHLEIARQPTRVRQRAEKTDGQF